MTDHARAVVVAAAVALTAAAACAAEPTAETPVTDAIAAHYRGLPPSHGEVDLAALRRAIAARPGQPVVVNAWATWCIPCRKKMPDLVVLEREFRPRGVRFLAVSIDTADAYATEAKPFLEKTAVRFPSWRKADGNDGAFIDGIDPTWSGELPALFLYGSDGKLRKRLSGGHDRESLRREIATLLVAPGEDAD